MNKKTNDFIIYLKSHTEAENENRFGDYYLNATAKYLSNMSGTPIEHYDKNILYSYIQSAFKDFMSTVDSPRLVMYDFFTSFNHSTKKSSDPDLALAHACCVAMDLSNVREKKNGVWMAVNGFHVPADPKDSEILNPKNNIS